MRFSAGVRYRIFTILSCLTSATVTAGLFLKTVQIRPASWRELLFQSVLCITLSITGALLGGWTFRSILEGRIMLRTPKCIFQMATPSAYLPSLFVSLSTHSLWLLPATGFAMGCAFNSLRSMRFMRAEPTSSSDPGRCNPLLSGFSAVSPYEGPPLFCFLMALSLLATVCCMADNAIVLGTIVASIGLSLVLWRKDYRASIEAHRATRRASNAGYVATSILVTLGALSSYGRMPSVAHNAMQMPQKRGPAEHSANHFSIILWPPYKKHISIYNEPRNLNPQSIRTGPLLTKAVTISFDGPYLYFKSPDDHPGPNAHIVHGDPTRVNVRSTDSIPIRMMARQTLSPPLNIKYFRAISVSITNADTRLGIIGVSLILADSTSPGAPSQYLGELPLRSTESANIPMDRPPIKETLKFSLPQELRITQLSSITIVFHLAEERGFGGAQVSIDKFVLLP
jgi:hypothetical protein